MEQVYLPWMPVGTASLASWLFSTRATQVAHKIRHHVKIEGSPETSRQVAREYSFNIYWSWAKDATWTCFPIKQSSISLTTYGPRTQCQFSYMLYILHTGKSQAVMGFVWHSGRGKTFGPRVSPFPRFRFSRRYTETYRDHPTQCLVL